MLWVGFPAVPDAAQSKTPRDRKVSKEAASDDQDSPGRKTQLRDKGRKDYLKLPLSPPAAAAAAAATGLTPQPPHPSSFFARPLPSPQDRPVSPSERQSDVPSAAGHQGLIKEDDNAESSQIEEEAGREPTVSVPNASDWK